MSTIIKISRLNIIVFLIIYRIYLSMANITKLQLSEELYNIAYDPIMLDQEESSSTTSAPSSNYLKSVVASLNQSISDLSGIVNNNLLINAQIPISYYTSRGYTSLKEITNTITRGVYCIYGNDQDGALSEFTNANFSIASWICGIIGIQGPGDYLLIGTCSNSLDKFIIARGTNDSGGSFNHFIIL